MYFLTQHGASISELPIDPECACIHEHVCIQRIHLFNSLHVVLENIPQKKYPNYNVKLQYQYRIKLEMSNYNVAGKTHLRVN